MEFRTEKDSLGEMQVPAAALWGPQTQRAVENFPISGRPLPPAFIHTLGLIKAAAARVNRDLGLVEAPIADAIERAANEVAEGKWDAEFPIDVYQTGSGTSSNMNANEVIARLASRASGLKVHPNDHVNFGQSSNDVIPTALHVSAVVQNRATTCCLRSRACGRRSTRSRARSTTSSRPVARISWTRPPSASARSSPATPRRCSTASRV
jgi:fumarate hydratase class II